MSGGLTAGWNIAPPPPGPITVNPPGRSPPTLKAKAARSKPTKRNTIGHFPFLSFFFLGFLLAERGRFVNALLNLIPLDPARLPHFRSTPCEECFRASPSRIFAADRKSERAQANNQNTHHRFPITRSRSNNH